MKAPGLGGAETARPGKEKQPGIRPWGRGRAAGVQPPDLSPAPPSPPDPGSPGPQPQNLGLSASPGPRSQGSERRPHSDGILGPRPSSLDPGIRAPNPHLPETPGPGSLPSHPEDPRGYQGTPPGAGSGKVGRGHRDPRSACERSGAATSAVPHGAGPRRVTGREPGSDVTQHLPGLGRGRVLESQCPGPADGGRQG